MTNPELWRPDPIAELEVPCAVCRHGYSSHEDGGGHCRAILTNGPLHRLPCMCQGMRWLLPGPAPTYSGRPEPSAP